MSIQIQMIKCQIWVLGFDIELTFELFNLNFNPLLLYKIRRHLSTMIFLPLMW
jgi:hypothetical protein